MTQTKHTLPDALHARPANMLVRVASSFAAKVTVHAGPKKANAKSIIEVLSLAARKGQEIELTVEGADEADASAALCTLIQQNFSADLVPETGQAAVLGIAVGRAHVIQRDDDEDDGAANEVDLTNVERRFHAAKAELEADIARLSAAERELLEPELIIMAELEPRVRDAVAAGKDFATAVEEETAHGMTDLFLDARTRLLGEMQRIDWQESAEPSILVAPSLPPSLVASLPSWVVGVVSAMTEVEERHGTGNTSHAAILARSRGIPLAFVDASVTDSIEHGDQVVLDASSSPARVFVSPSDKLLSDAIARRDASLEEREKAFVRAAHLAATMRVSIRVNVSRRDEKFPREARGVGLVRTELVFASHRTRPPKAEQVAAYREIAENANGHPVSVRLFDAGGDKPLAWLPAHDPNVRGAELLFAHEPALRDQLEAIAEARTSATAPRALIPLTRNADDVKRVRALAPKGLGIGAMIETREAIDHVDAIAREADYLSIGTNDLTASILGVARADAARGLEPPVLAAIEKIVAAARAHKREVTVCGELAAHPDGAIALVAAGVHALSVAIPAFSSVVEIVSRSRGGPET